jgi:hypothetical protein
MTRNIRKPAQRVKLLRLSSDRSSLYSLNQGIEIGGLLNRSNGAGFVPCLCQKIEKPWICLVSADYGNRLPLCVSVIGSQVATDQISRRRYLPRRPYCVPQQLEEIPDHYVGYRTDQSLERGVPFGARCVATAPSVHTYSGHALARPTVP